MSKKCDYTGNREDALMSYLYGEFDPPASTEFEGHLNECGVCRQEVAELRGVRAELRMWTPPDVDMPVLASASPFAHRSWWQEVPLWAQVGAAFLCLGVGAGLANLNVQYAAGTLTVHTGWSRTAVSDAASKAASAPAVPAAAAAPWRGDLTALERQLRVDFQPAGNGAPRAPLTTSSTEDVLKRVRALVAESERKQQRELALRIAEVFHDVQTQRQADLVKIDRSLSMLQNNTGVEVMRQRQLINSLAVRVSQKQ
jgi:anti-sigma factor RsiW